MEHLFKNKGTAIALNRNLNLTDFFFKYGVRIEPVLVKDLYYTPIVLASGIDHNTQYQPVPWYYSPMVFSKDQHPISTNLEALRFEFTSAIKLLNNPNKKTVLLQSSPLSKLVGVPVEVSLQKVNQAPKKESFNNGNQNLAVLIEGDFDSAFKNRIKPIRLENDIEQGKQNKMIVIADGDVIKNQLRKGTPIELGYDKWTNNFYGNKEFLMNCTQYLLEDSGLINIRAKKIKIAFLDQEKIAQEKLTWQVINLGIPVALLLIFRWMLNYRRTRKHRSIHRNLIP